MMVDDEKKFEELLELITREVILSLKEKTRKSGRSGGSECCLAIAEGLCVTTCVDQNGDAVHVRAVNTGMIQEGDPITKNLAGMIDHTLLKPDTNLEQIIQLCAEAREHSFASVCINPCWVRLSADLLRGSPVKVCTVIGFPLGASTTETKVFETNNAITLGAEEIDMVINVGAVKTRDLEQVVNDIRGVVKAAHERKALVKVIIETSLLSDEEKVIACLLSREAGADYVKTSTGFSGGGATIEDVRLMRRTVGPDLGVKASGGVRTYEDAEAMIKAGATRIGTSSGIKIIQGTAL